VTRFPGPPTPVGSSSFRIQLTYWWRHRRLARLARPLLLTEWIQHRKLNDRDPRLPALADKVRVKAHVAKRLGSRWVTRSLWRGVRLPEEPAWDFPYVVKARHGCQQTMVVRSAADHAVAVTASRRWMAQAYGGWLDEWLYGEIERGLLIEPYIGDADVLPVDYKIFVFGGRARFIQVHLGRASDHRWIVLDRDWRRVSPATRDANPPRPASLAAMLLAAERLSDDFPFVRADFYEIAGQPRFGELTFYPGSGLEKVEPLRLDLLMGLLWSDAVAQAGRQSGALAQAA